MNARVTNVARIPQRQFDPQSLTETMLISIMSTLRSRRRELAQCLPHLIAAMQEFDITNKPRAAAFLATLAQESGELRYFKETGDRKYFQKYEGRITDLGNTHPGDGFKYRGRGAIQITGRFNCEACLKALGLPAGHPEVLEEVENAFRSAGWFWRHNPRRIDLNPLADKGSFLKIQSIVNGTNRKTGKPNHWDQRSEYYGRALRALPDGWTLETGMESIDPLAQRALPHRPGNPLPSLPSPGTDDDVDDHSLAMLSAVDNADIDQGMRPDDPSVVVKPAAPAKERTLKSLVCAVTTALSSLGVAFGAVFTEGVDKLKQNPELVVLISVAMIAILVCHIMYQYRQTKLDLADRAHAKDVTLEMMKIGSDPGRYNVAVMPRAVPPDPDAIGA